MSVRTPVEVDEEVLLEVEVEVEVDVGTERDDEVEEESWRAACRVSLLRCARLCALHLDYSAPCSTLLCRLDRCARLQCAFNFGSVHLGWGVLHAAYCSITRLHECACSLLGPWSSESLLCCLAAHVLLCTSAPDAPYILGRA